MRLVFALQQFSCDGLCRLGDLCRNDDRFVADCRFVADWRGVMLKGLVVGCRSSYLRSQGCVFCGLLLGEITYGSSAGRFVDRQISARSRPCLVRSDR